MKLSNTLIQVISEAVKNALYEYENIENKEYVIKTYTKENDYQYVKDNSQKFFNFLDAGYVFAGLDHYCGCSSAKALARNFNVMKIAYVNDVIIAISVYTGYQDGKKCVGITATTDDNLRELGKQAVIDIIKSDINFMNDFYWIECSGAAEHLYKKYGVVMIPNDYIQLFIGNKFDEKLDDGYHFNVKFTSSDDGDVTTIKKCIFGFNNKRTYDIVKEKLDAPIKKQIEYIMNCVRESSNILVHRDKYQAAHDIVYVFYDEKCHGVNEFSEEYIDILKDSTKILEEYIKDNPNDERVDKFETAIWNAHDILDTSTCMTLHKIG